MQGYHRLGGRWRHDIGNWCCQSRTRSSPGRVFLRTAGGCLSIGGGGESLRLKLREGKLAILEIGEG